MAQHLAQAAKMDLAEVLATKDLKNLCRNMLLLRKILNELNQNEVQNLPDLSWNLHTTLRNIERDWRNLLVVLKDMDRHHHKSIDGLLETLKSHTIGVFTKAYEDPVCKYKQRWFPIIVPMLEMLLNMCTF